MCVRVCVYVCVYVYSRDFVREHVTRIGTSVASFGDASSNSRSRLIIAPGKHGCPFDRLCVALGRNNLQLSEINNADARRRENNGAIQKNEVIRNYAVTSAMMPSGEILDCETEINRL